MKKTLLGVLALASVALAGCVAVPAYDAPYYGPPVAYGPAPVVVAPSVSFGYSRGYYGHGYRHYRHWR
ncbi:MAG TPA: hypothetical protein VHN19_09250 [Burkholderiales bacterium]|jgi:hypothetical protein|nr:hypothetical protein [Burkholderiales bacterium]